MTPRQTIKFRKGEQVFATWKGNLKVYRALVLGVNDDGTYSLIYADGDTYVSIRLFGVCVFFRVGSVFIPASAFWIYSRDMKVPAAAIRSAS